MAGSNRHESADALHLTQHGHGAGWWRRDSCAIQYVTTAMSSSQYCLGLSSCGQQEQAFIERLLSCTASITCHLQ